MYATVTPLGLSQQELAQALGRYRLGLHALIHAVPHDRVVFAGADSLRILEELSQKVEVDRGARESAAGGERMTPVERDHLVPLLDYLHRELTGLSRHLPTDEWLAKLRAADEHVATLERRLAHHGG